MTNTQGQSARQLLRLGVSLVGLLATTLQASGPALDLPKAPINGQDTASLQRGARLYTDFCLGCHSLNYIRYERLNTDLKIPVDIIEDEFIFDESDIFAQMRIATPKAYSTKWFGVQPPDLTLETRLRSPDWVYNYLIGFYEDDSRPLGVNNTVFADVGMPHVMANMQATVSEEKFNLAMADITNFLAYTGDPTKQQRERIGRWILLFLAILFIPVWLLNREYWKNIR